MDARLAAYTARRVVETFARDPNVSADLRRVLTELLGADVKTFTHARVSAQIKLTVDGLEHLEQGTDVDLVTIVDGRGRGRVLILV